MTISVYTNSYKISPMYFTARWKSSVPASCHSCSCGCSAIIPLDTSASPGLNLRKQLNFNPPQSALGAPKPPAEAQSETLCQPQMSENIL